MIAQPRPDGRNRSSQALSFVGILWLLLAIALIAYRFANPPTVKIEWDTATEVDSAGFYLYKSQSPSGDFVTVNSDLIPSKGNAVTGASYNYVDSDVEPGETYYYVLEEIEQDSSTNRYEEDMFSYTVPDRWWIIVASAVSLVIGLALVITGVREGRNR